MFSLSELLKGHIILELKGETKEDILRELVNRVSEIEDKERKKEILKLILQRENEASTGIGLGVAIPHIRTKLVDYLLLYASRTKNEIDFNSIDGYPVQLVFLLIIPESLAKSAANILSTIVKILKDDKTRQNLLKAKTEKEFINAFLQNDV